MMIFLLPCLSPLLLALFTFVGLGIILGLLRYDDEPDWHEIVHCSIVTAGVVTLAACLLLFFPSWPWWGLSLAAVATSIRTFAGLSWLRLLIALVALLAWFVAAAVLLALLMQIPAFGR